VQGDEYLDVKPAVIFSTRWADISFKTILYRTATNRATFQLPEE
jgi:hypothetical protein